MKALLLPLPISRQPTLAAILWLALGVDGPLSAGRDPLDLERERFLLEAEIGTTETISVGVTAPLRATLSLDGVTHDAHIQRIDATIRRFRGTRRTYANFKDCYRFNIAAYRLDRLLGLQMVPVSVERRYRGKKAAVTWWVDDVLMTDADRYRQKISPPDPERWTDQKDQARIFNQLVCNEDPNLGNFLITRDWRLWLVDFSRAFRRWKELQEPQLVRRIDRRLYDGLVALEPEALERETAPYLTRTERKAVMARRQKILEILAQRIATHGEAAVICDLPGH